MEKAVFNPWARNETIVEEAYAFDNYRERIHVDCDEFGKGRCIIYCSSNAIWYPNTRECFEQSILLKDRYEWEKITPSCFEKEIFLRDIFKSWYVTGINKACSSIDDLLEQIRELTRGFSLSVFGVSSGAYLAIIIGVVLAADYVAAFSPQTDLWHDEITTNPFLQKYQYDEARSKYYNIKSFMERSNVPIYYIAGIHSKQDMYYYSSCKGISSFYPILFNSDKHGAILGNDVLRELTTYDIISWKELYGKLRGVAEVNTFRQEYMGYRQ